MVRIRITKAGAEPGSLRVRVPEWAEGLAVRVNGSLANFPQMPDTSAPERMWRAGDVIEVKYAMKLRSTASGENRISYSYGPWLLGAPASENPAYFNEMTTENKLVRGKEVVHGRPGSTHRAASPCRLRRRACPYVAAEFPDQPATVELRAIAEQTGQPTTSWELRFLTEEQDRRKQPGENSGLPEPVESPPMRPGRTHSGRSGRAEKSARPCKLGSNPGVYLSDGSRHDSGTDDHGHGG